MGSIPIHKPPIRITDLIKLKRTGAAVTCSPVFEIIPVDFTHRTCRFRALVFICRFNGTVDRQKYTFRKCYARGCEHDSCPRVSQAVIIANRYLLRDYQRLQESGLPVEKKLFSLEESLIQLTDIKEDPRQALVIDDYVEMAKGGSRVSVGLVLEYVPATEHFEYNRKSQTYLLTDFVVTTWGTTAVCQRCFGCYATDKEHEERPVQIQLANDRLSLLYREFDQFCVKYDKKFFA